MDGDGTVSVCQLSEDEEEEAPIELSKSASDVEKMRHCMMMISDSVPVTLQENQISDGDIMHQFNFEDFEEDGVESELMCGIYLIK